MIQQKISLKAQTKSRFLKYIRNILEKHSIQEIVLVVDIYCLKLLSNLFKINELVQVGITFIQRLELKRKILETHHALYFIEPQNTSIQTLTMDFRQKRQYKKIHILFPYAILKQYLNLISLEKNVIKYTGSIKEFYHTLYFIEDNVCSMRINYFQYAYSQGNSAKELKLREIIASSFIQILHSIEKFYQINVYYKLSQNKISEKIASAVKDKIQRFIEYLYRNKSDKINKQAQNIEVLLMDRGIDPITPLIHDFHYQPMLFDMVGIKLEKDFKLEKKVQQQPKQKKKEKKQQLIQKQILEQQPINFNDIQDKIYEKYRYKHLAELLEELPKEIQEFKQRRKNLKQEDLFSIDQNDNKAYQTHVKLAKRCDIIFKQRNLADVGELEQSLSTGIDQEGQQTSSVKLIAIIRKILAEKQLTEQQKIRLTLLCYCCISFSQTDFKSILCYLKQQHKRLFSNMAWLGVTLNNTVKKSTKNIGENLRKIAKQKLKATEMNLSRYSSFIELSLPLIIQSLAQGEQIDKQLFSVIKINVNEQKVSKQETKKRKKISTDLKKRILIIFFIGGISYAEIRVIKSLQQKYFNVIVISDNLITGQSYIKSIEMMASPL